MRHILFKVLGAAALCAAPALAQVGTVSGHVTAPGGIPIAGVEVRLAGSATVTQTDDRGAFMLPGIAKGLHTMQFRSIGYLPAQVGVRVPERADSLVVTLVPSNRTLDTVRVVASLNVLGGIVVDSDNRPMPGVAVNMIGPRSAATTTDANGWFTFTSVRSGPVIVRAVAAGYHLATYSLQLEDWRGLVLRMQPLDAGLSASKALEESGLGTSVALAWKEADRRLTMRDPRSMIVSREALAPLGEMPLGEAVDEVGGMLALRSQIGLDSERVCVLEDGRRMVGASSLNDYRADQVDFIEIYPPGTEASGSVARNLRLAACRGVRVSLTGSRGPMYAVVWLR